MKTFDTSMKENPTDLYDICFCPFCGFNNMKSYHWAKGISYCMNCEARFQVFETKQSDRKDFSDKTAL